MGKSSLHNHVLLYLLYFTNLCFFRLELVSKKFMHTSFRLKILYDFRRFEVNMLLPKIVLFNNAMNKKCTIINNHLGVTLKK